MSPPPKENPISTATSWRDSRAGVITTFAKAGFPVIALQGKLPLSPAFQKTPANPDIDPNNFPRNYGLLVPDDVVVMDIDPRNFADEDRNSPMRYVKAVLERCGLTDNPSTLTVRSGGGGLHFYFRKPSALPLKEKIPGFPGIEFKNKGRYLVGPMSVHPDTGKTYDILKGHPAKLMQAPDVMLKMLEKHDEVIGQLGEYSDDEVTRRRFSRLLENAPVAIEGSGGDVLTLKTAMKGRDLGLSPEVTLEIMFAEWNPRCQPPWAHEELEIKVGNAYRYATNPQGSSHPLADFGNYEIDPIPDITEDLTDKIRWDLDDRNRMRPSAVNATQWMKLRLWKPGLGRAEEPNPVYRLLRYNLFTNKIEFAHKAPWQKQYQREMTDMDVSMYRDWLATRANLSISLTAAHEGMAAFAHKYQAFHPVKEYFESLQWDAKPRLDSLLPYYAGAKDTAYVREVGKNTLLAAVARIYEPGRKFDHLLILEGEQGTGKSTFCRTLAREWYSEIHIDPHNKDTYEAMKGSLIVEIAELEAVRKAEATAMKWFLSKQSDKYRPAYGRVVEDNPRQCVFIGTYNPDHGGAGYLKDDTGNRRYWPVETHAFDIAALQEDIDQIWAEAVYRYKHGELFHLTDESIIRQARREQTLREIPDPWREMLEIWLQRIDKINPPRVLTPPEIAEYALQLNPAKLTRADYARIGAALNAIGGWEKGQFYHPTRRMTVRGYRRIPDFDLLNELDM